MRVNLYRGIEKLMILVERGGGEKGQLGVGGANAFNVREIGGHQLTG
jgi:hypothetical protein